MARIPYPDLSQSSEVVRQGLAQLPVQLNIFRLLAHAETAFVPSVLLGRAILGQLELDPKIRELVILQVAKETEARYEWVQHIPIAQATGVTDEQIALVDRGVLEAEVFDRKERLALAVAREVLREPCLSDATFEQVRLHFSPREIVEVLLTVGYYQMLARLMTILEIDLDVASGTQVSDAAQGLQRHREERPQTRPTHRSAALAETQPVRAAEGTQMMTIEESFQHLRHRFHPSAATGINKVVQVVITGEHALNWALRIANDTCEVMVGEVERPDTIMILGETDWLAFVEGTMDPVNAFMMGKLKVTGDVLFAARLQALFPKP
jgi:4-carboxymuconolactone decarboxylase